MIFNLGNDPVRGLDGGQGNVYCYAKAYPSELVGGRHLDQSGMNGYGPAFKQVG